MLIISKIYRVKLDNFSQKPKKVTTTKNFNNILDSYTVKRGDSLYKIAKNYLLRKGIKPTSENIMEYIHKICEVNNIINPNKIYAGQVINFENIALLEKNSDFIVPVKGYVSSKFGMRIDPFTKEMRFHSGVDIAAPIGTPIHAAKGGKVLFSGYERGYGNIVIIKHSNNVITKYAHVSKYFVKKGDIVKQNDIIALVGSTGRSTGPHLHFEVRINNRAINPLKFIKI